MKHKYFMTYRGRWRGRRRRRGCSRHRLGLDNLDIVGREETLLRAVRADAGPPSLVQLLDLLDELALGQVHLVVLLRLVRVLHNRAYTLATVRSGGGNRSRLGLRGRGRRWSDGRSWRWWRRWRLKMMVSVYAL